MGATPLPSEAIDRQELVALTRRLVRTPSVDRPGEGEERVAELVADLLRGRGFQVTVEEAAPGRPNVVGLHDSGRPGPTLLFEAHSDVVTEGDAATWRHPPFEAVVEGGRLYGRGACDTKGNLAAALLAVSALRESGGPARGRLMLACPVDEEGMMIGIKRFIEGGWAEGVSAAIICEPEENQVCIAQKGALRLRITVEGEMAHGAMPLTGLNPLPALARIVEGLGELEREEIGRHGLDDLLGYPSITPTVVRAPRRGDPQLNVVPGNAELLVDVRTVRGQDHAGLVADVKELCRRVEAEVNEDLRQGEGAALRRRLRPGLGEGLELAVGVELLDDRPWTETDQDEPVVRAVERAVREVTGGEPIRNGVPGATDGTFLWATGIPIVTTGAGDRFVPHQRDEWVDLEELHRTALIYLRAAEEYFELTAG